MLSARLTKDEWSKLSPTLQAEYAVDGDGYRLQVQAAAGLELAEVANLRTALERERVAAKEATRQLSSWEGLHVTPDQARDALAAAKLGSADIEARVSASVKARTAEVESRLGTLAKERDEAFGQARKGAISREIAAAVTKAKARSAFMPLIERHVESLTDLVTDDKGRSRVVIKDPVHGGPRMTRRSDGGTSDMTVEEFVTNLRDDAEWSMAFEGTAATGPGAAAHNGTPGRSSKVDLAALPAEQRINAARAQGLRT